VQADNQSIVGGEINAIRHVLADGENEVTAIESAECDPAATVEDE
jgi:hypothetical protein